MKRKLGPMVFTVGKKKTKREKPKISSHQSGTNIHLPAILDEDEDVDPDLKSLRVFRRLELVLLCMKFPIIFRIACKHTIVADRALDQFWQSTLERTVETHFHHCLYTGLSSIHVFRKKIPIQQNIDPRSFSQAPFRR